MEQSISKALTNIEASLVKYQAEVNLDLENINLYFEHLSNAVLVYFIFSIAFTVICSTILLAIMKFLFVKKSDFNLSLNRIGNLEKEVEALKGAIATLLNKVEAIPDSSNNLNFDIEDIEYIED